MKKNFFLTLSSICSIVFSLVIVEVSLLLLPIKFLPLEKPRWIFRPTGLVHGCQQLDGETIYRPIPNNTSDECWRTDKYGLRVSSFQKKDNAMNILFIGDSFTFGHDVGDDETYPYYIQQILGEKGVSANVYNGGIPGYSTDQQVVFFENLIEDGLKPNIVVWNINENDEDDNDQACLFSVENGVLKQHPGYFNTIYLLGSLYQKMPNIIKKSKTFLLLFQAVPDRWTIGCSQDTRNNESSRKEKTVLLLQRIQTLSKKYNFNLIVTYIQSQFAYLKTPPSWYVDSTQKKLQTIHTAGIEPIIISEEILKMISHHQQHISSLNAVVSKNILGISTDNLEYTLFLPDNAQSFGNKHMNAFGNQLFAYAFYLNGLKEKLDKYNPGLYK